MAQLTSKPGFAPPRAEKILLKRSALGLELLATVALTVSLVVAATAVSIGNRSLVHDPEKRAPVFQKDHAPPKS